MKVKNGLRIAQRVIVFSLILNLMIGICVAGHTGNQADDIVTTALSQVGYTAGWRDDTKYGDWYGSPHAYWCAMFVSWCARNAGISINTVPHISSCTAVMRWFAQRGLWQNSAWRGGNYVPVRGDLILFNWTQQSNCNHIGIVIKTDGGYVYTVEGNILTYRWADRGSPDPDDPMRVCIRQYALDSTDIRGYGTPRYRGRDIAVPEPKGFVDLADYAKESGKIEVVAQMNLLPPLSGSLYGELYRASRADFISALVKIFCLDEVKVGTQAFSDVPQGAPLYWTMMIARSAGLLQGDENNNCSPYAQLTLEAAKNILYRTESYMQGSMPWMNLGEEFYVVRGRLAVSLYDILIYAPVVSSVNMEVVLNGEARQLAAYQSGNAYYVKLEALRALLEDTDKAFQTRWSDSEQAIMLMSTAKVPFDPSHWASPTNEWRRTLNKTVRVWYGDQVAEIPAVTINGETCYQVDNIAALMGVDLTWN